MTSGMFCDYRGKPCPASGCDCGDEPDEIDPNVCPECEHPKDSEPHLQHCPEAIRG